jgi:type IV fimbrial biogenesis protein FimT
VKDSKELLTENRLHGGDPKGFSMLELVVVMAIIGTLVAVAIPNFIDWSRKHQLKDSVSDLAGNLNLARMAAIHQNATVTVRVTQAAPASPILVTFASSTGANALPTMNVSQTAFGGTADVNLTNANGDFVGSGFVNSPQGFQFTPMGLKVDTGNANNICINAAGAGTGAACTNADRQALNFRNTRGDNYRIVVMSTGKVSWCYAPSCAQ